MSLVSPSQSSPGGEITAAAINTPVNQLAAVVNGNIDSTNIAASGVGTSQIADGAVTAVKLAGTAWTTFTPTWTSLTVGNGTVVARYTQIGKTVKGYVRFIFGSTSVIPTPNPTFTVPVAANTTTYDATKNNVVGTVEIDDVGVSNYNGLALFLASLSGITVFVTAAGGTYATSTPITSTVPMTWNTGDYFSVQFTYEAA